MKKCIIFTICILLVIPSFGTSTSGLENDASLPLMVFKSIMYVVIFIIVILFAMYGTKFIARRSQSMLKSKYIHIIDSVNIGQNTKIIIAKISNFIYILSLNNNQTYLIDKMSIDTFFENVKQNNFEEYLNEYIDGNKDWENSSLIIKDKVKKVLDKINFTKIGKEDEKNEKDS
ncbi:flagellar biosynthetic protein FliO [Anaerosalibacter sp. Marseille-P3206]|uniref:flagellar biosynthetic protein FliO n=1 Tax=Anaerosalibacter sp. Marseille-P3206 TaxID=1871005 RepID=UPI0011774C04|nr:flagellar biosynthetic protein FliO [Anaerosalibacter sp. Marseille-P3206]